MRLLGEHDSETRMLGYALITQTTMLTVYVFVSQILKREQSNS